MTIPISQLANTQTFGTWLQRTNDLSYVISTNAVTTDSSTGGSITTGNGFVNGIFGANTLYVTTLSAGNIAVNGSLITITSNLYANGTAIFGNNTTNVHLGYLTSASNIQENRGSQNNFVQVILQNANNGSNACSDFVAHNDTGIDTNIFSDMGINGSNWSAPFWSINGGNDSYFYSANNNMSIGTAGAGYVNFFTGGTLITNEVMRITPGANVGIGTSSPDAKFKVQGTANVTGNVVIQGAIQGTNTINITGNSTFGNTMYVLGNTTLANTLNVVGAANLQFTANVGNTLGVTGATLLSNTLNVVGAANLQLSANVAGYLTVNGATTIANTLNVINAANLQSSANIAGYLTVNGATTIANTIAVSGNNSLLYINSTANAFILTTNSTVTALNIYGNTVFSNNVYYIGDGIFNANINANGTALNVTNSIVVSNSGTITVSSVNSTANGTSITNNSVTVGNSSVNAVMTANLIMSGNASKITISNTATGSNNFLVNSSVITVGNSTVNTTVNGGNITLANINIGTISSSSNGLFANSTYIVVGNSTVNTTIYNANITANTINTYNLNVSGSITGSFAAGGNIIPSTNNSFTLGSTANVFSSTYSSNLFSNNITVYNTTTITGNTTLTGNTNLIGQLTLSTNTTSNTSTSIANTYQFQNNIIQTVDQFGLGTYRTAEYTVQLSDATPTTPYGYQISKLLVVHNGASAFVTEYGSIMSNTSGIPMATFTATINGANVVLQGTAIAALSNSISSNVVLKFIRTVITV